VNRENHVHCTGLLFLVVMIDVMVKLLYLVMLLGAGADLEGGRAGSGPPFGDGPTYAVSTTPSLTAYVRPSLKGAPLTL